MTAWIFQGNPKTFDVDRYLRASRDITWTVKPKRNIESGDRALIWRADGPNRGTGGIVAVGRTMGTPQPMPLDPDDVALWKNKLDVASDPTALRVPIHIDEVRLTPNDGMLLRIDIEEHPVLRSLPILHYRAVMVCLISPIHERTISQLWENRLRFRVVYSC